jgi:hypothetical protein
LLLEEAVVDLMLAVVVEQEVCSPELKLLQGHSQLQLEREHQEELAEYPEVMEQTQAFHQ